MVITNANTISLDENSGTMPNVGEVLLNWLQKMTFTKVAKIVNGIFQVSETPTNYSFMGVWQPSSPSSLEMRAQGQRKWNWFECHAQPGIALEPDDVVIYLGIQYRVMSQNDYSLNGYIQYRLINDYTGSGPA